MLISAEEHIICQKCLQVGQHVNSLKSGHPHWISASKLQIMYLMIYPRPSWFLRISWYNITFLTISYKIRKPIWCQQSVLHSIKCLFSFQLAVPALDYAIFRRRTNITFNGWVLEDQQLDVFLIVKRWMCSSLISKICFIKFKYVFWANTFNCSCICAILFRNNIRIFLRPKWSQYLGVQQKFLLVACWVLKVYCT